MLASHDDDCLAHISFLVDRVADHQTLYRPLRDCFAYGEPGHELGVSAALIAEIAL